MASFLDNVRRMYDLGTLVVKDVQDRSGRCGQVNGGGNYQYTNAICAGCVHEYTSGMGVTVMEQDDRMRFDDERSCANGEGY